MLGSAFGRQQAVGYHEQQTEQLEVLCHKSLSGHCRPQSIVSGVVRRSGDENTILQVDGNCLELAEGNQKEKTFYLGTEPWTTLVEAVGMDSVTDRIDGLQWLGGR